MCPAIIISVGRSKFKRAFGAIFYDLEAAMEFTKNTRLKDILNLPCFQPMLGQFIASSASDWFHGKGELSLAELQQQNPTWYWEDVAYGLNHLQKIALGGGRYVYPVGEGACLIHLPAENRRYEAYAILNAGGAYGAVCTMVEALPAAARLNELGMDCFCLNYRTATQSSFTEGLLPKPLEDLALACRYIKGSEAAFRLDAENYIVGGFSAGGHLAAMWGAENHGARHFGIPNPRALLLAYPLIGLENLSGPAAQLLRSGLLGIHSGEERIAEYTASRQVGSGYPPVYLVRAEDDHTVPKQDAADMETALAKAEIPHRIERVPSGGHGFGLGTATAANGWISRALDFVEENRYAK